MLTATSIADIDEGLDEKGAARHLESITQHLSFACFFVVVQNTVSALESIEIMSFDIIFVGDNINASSAMSAYEFLRITKVIGMCVPVVLLVSDQSNPQQPGLPVSGFHPANPHEPYFSMTLMRPYTRSELCMTICHAFTAPTPPPRTTGTAGERALPTCTSLSTTTLSLADIASPLYSSVFVPLTASYQAQAFAGSGGAAHFRAVSLHDEYSSVPPPQSQPLRPLESLGVMDIDATSSYTDDMFRGREEEQSLRQRERSQRPLYSESTDRGFKGFTAPMYRQTSAFAEFKGG